MPNVIDDDVGSPLGQFENDGAADAAPATRDQRQLARKVAFGQVSEALTLRSTLPFSAPEIGQPSLAASAALVNAA